MQDSDIYWVVIACFSRFRPLLCCSAISVGDLIPPVHSTDSCRIRRTMQCTVQVRVYKSMFRKYVSKIFLPTQNGISDAKLCLCVSSASRSRVGAMLQAIHSHTEPCWKCPHTMSTHTESTALCARCVWGGTQRDKQWQTESDMFTRTALGGGK